MTVTINGEEKELPEGMTLLGCIRFFNWDPEVVVAELNGQIIGKEDFEGTRIYPGDCLELLHFVGGG